MNRKEPIEFDLSTNRKKLYIFFGGIKARIAMPPFEFYKSSKIINESKIFIRDFYQCWYHAGLPGISHDIHSTSKYIEKQIKSINPEKVFFVGNSMGGYAAILFATLIGKGEVIAFSPQTFISPLLRLVHADFRWKKRILYTYKRSLFKTKAWDIKPLVKGHSRNLKISIFVSKDSRIDYIHASHLRSIPNIEIFEFSSGGHGVVKLLRDEGKLPDIMLGNYTQ